MGAWPPLCGIGKKSDSARITRLTGVSSCRWCSSPVNGPCYVLWNWHWRQAPTKTQVLNLLHRLLDGTPTDQPDVTPPEALALRKEPEANVARYDGLRGGTRHAS